jgi:hypothetical protein
MGTFRFLILLFIVSTSGCSRQQGAIPTKLGSVAVNVDYLPAMEHSNRGGKGALLLTNFKSFEELKAVIQIEYFKDNPDSDSVKQGNTQVRLTHCSSGREVTSILKPGVSEFDFLCARDSSLWYRVRLAFISPYAVMHRGDLLGIEILGRRRYGMFGEGDMAFYDIAETMVFNINDDDTMFMSCEDLSEKGYLNTFNHITAQALMTSIFSERLADFIADVHERFHIPELISGEFTDDQIKDIEEGPVDNYIDMINNEWGQELGKLLSEKYNISRKTYWTPELLACYLNDIQSYNSWAFQIGFKPFRPTDELVIRFSSKINRVVKDAYEMSSYYY